jgi:hypothetical protein
VGCSDDCVQVRSMGQEEEDGWSCCEMEEGRRGEVFLCSRRGWGDALVG